LSPSSKDDKEGILLVHGFGASGTQWNKLMSELSQTSALPAFQGLAPDLIGFGQSEKPAISYTSYMWDSQLMDFLKEIAVYRNQWRSFVTGGNSIGGFTSMSLAACDSASGKQLSSSGSSGTGLCSGLVLMNSAGPIKTREESEQETSSKYENWSPSTVAETTATGRLQICSPPPRPVARIFGNVLLSFLRPNIQSICRNLYPTNPLAVDDFLVQEIERDSLDPGAVNVMMAGAKLPPPRTANELLGAQFGVVKNSDGDKEILESTFEGPILIAQGVLDPLNNSTDSMNRLHALRDGIDVAPIPAGHCPHDELPGEVAKSIAHWMLTRTTKHSRIANDSRVISFEHV
jgi:pimeloyl-ACP methyl ester carboxylesterase